MCWRGQLPTLVCVWVLLASGPLFLLGVYSPVCAVASREAVLGWFMYECMFFFVFCCDLSVNDSCVLPCCSCKLWRWIISEAPSANLKGLCKSYILRFYRKCIPQTIRKLSEGDNIMPFLLITMSLL